MKCLNFVFWALLVFFCTSCQKSTEPINNDIPPPGFQKDIPWPSLANSPWPMNHGDPQSTGRSKFTGPLTGTIIKEVEAINIQSGVSIGPDSTIYYCSGGDLVAMWPNGEIKWKIEPDESWEGFSTPLVSADGTIYIGTPEGNVFAVNPDSTIKWKVPVGDNIWQLRYALVRIRHLNSALAGMCQWDQGRRTADAKEETQTDKGREAGAA